MLRSVRPKLLNSLMVIARVNQLLRVDKTKVWFYVDQTNGFFNFSMFFQVEIDGIK